MAGTPRAASRTPCPLYVCIGHRAPDVSFPELDLFLSSERLGLPNEMHVPDVRPDLEGDGAVLAEYSQLFFLLDHLRAERRSCSHLYLFQYRKYLSLDPGAYPSSNQPYAFVATQESVGASFPARDRLFDACPHGLIGRPVKLPYPLLEQYRRYHHLEDLLAFARAAVRSGALSDQECAAMLLTDQLIPAPALGLFGIEQFLEVTERLRRAWGQFFREGFAPREGYQRRVGGFLLERLHSHLLLAARKDPARQPPALGYQFVVSRGARVRPTE